MTRINSALVLLFCACLLIACQREIPREMYNKTSLTGTYIVYQREPSQTSSGIAYIDKRDRITSDQYLANNHTGMSAPAANIQFLGQYGYALQPEEGQLLILDMEDFSPIGIVEGLYGATNLLLTHSSMAYVSAGAVNGKVYQVDLLNKRIIRTIDVGGFPRDLYSKDGNLYLNCTSPINSFQHEVWILDATSLALQQVLACAGRPMEFVEDREGRIWQLHWGYALSTGTCDGQLQYGARLMQLDPATMTWTEHTIFSEDEKWPTHLCISPNGEELYFLSQGVFRVPTKEPTHKQLLIENSGSALAVDPATGKIWMACARSDGSQNEIRRHNTFGELEKTIAFGMRPLEISFY